MKLARLLGITMSLLTHERITAQKFADKYEVSTRTIMRDMEELSMAGIPIVSIQGNAGGFSIMENFKLERNFLTVDEMAILRSVLEGFRDSVLDEESNIILDKLASVKESSMNMTDTDEMYDIVMDFSGWADPIHLKNMVQTLKRNIESNGVVEIQYFNNNGYETRRFIHPHRLLLKNSAWYLQAYCERAEAFRIFKLARIKVVLETERTFVKKTVDVPRGPLFGR